MGSPPHARAAGADLVPQTDALPRLVLHCVVDARNTVLESTAPRLSVGSSVTSSTWLGAEIVQAAERATQTGCPFRSVARDDRSGTHWLLEAAPESEPPLGARVTIVDATLAVQIQRDAELAKVVHAMRNVSFAMLSVVAAIQADAPPPDELAVYLSHLGGPAARLSATMTLMAELLLPIALDRRRVNAKDLIDQAVALAEPALHPGTVCVDPGLSMTVDSHSIARTIASMLESRLQVRAHSLAVDRIAVDDKPYVHISVVRPMAAEERTAVQASWDLAGGLDLDAALRLARGRAVVVAHGGSVFSEATDAGLARIGIRLPDEGLL